MRSPPVLFLAGTIVLLAVIASGQTNTPAQKQDQGELQIYSHATEIGTFARRTFRDENRRISREVFYASSNRGQRKPPSEKELRVQSIQFYRYDSQGFLVETETRGPDNRIIETKRMEHDESKDLARTSTFGPDGNLRARVYSRHGMTTSTVNYDATGKRVLTIRGPIPADVELPDGWGAPDSFRGVGCGLVLSKTNGALEDLVAHVNLKNTADRSFGVALIGDATMLLHDARGQVIPENPERAQQLPRPPVPQLHGFHGVELLPGEAGFLYPFWSVQERFPRLPRGQYRLSVRLPIDGIAAPLESNPVTFLVK